MSKKNHSLKFKRKKLKTPKSNPMKELMSLYDEGDEIMDIEAINEQEAEIDASTPLKKLIERTRAKKKKKFVFLVFFLLFIFASTALAGFLYFDKHKTFKQETISFEIIAPNKVKLGEPIEYTVKYQNIGDVVLNNTRLTIQYPHGLLVEATEPAINNHQWELGELDLYQGGEIKILGRIIDEIDREQKLVAKLIFEPENFKSQFSKEIDINTLLERPEIEFRIDYPSTITLGQKLNIETMIKNKDDLGFEKPIFQVIYPENFEYLSADPKPFEENKKWEMDILAPNSEDKKFTLEGKFPSDITFETEQDRSQLFKVQVQAKGVNDQYYLVAEQEFTVKITDQALLAYLIVNGSSENKTVELGNILTYSVVVKNNGNKAYNDLEVKAILDSSPFDIIDWEKIFDDNFGQIKKTNKGKEIIWTGDDIDKLSKLKPGKEVMISFTVPIKSYEQVKDANAETLGDTKIFNSAEIHIGGESNVEIPPLKSNPVTLNLTSNLDLEAKALYYYDDGTPIGYGPYPPEPGETTEVHVFWNITNDIHEVKDITVTATLPSHVSIAKSGSPTIGQFEIDTSNNQLTWTIETLPRTLKEVECSFAIQFTPNEKQSGKILQLLSNTTLLAKDTVTDAPILKTQNILTTALEQDKYITGSGEVK
jgi:uncharacterized repeat protein (TIGR01451 family)